MNGTNIRGDCSTGTGTDTLIIPACVQSLWGDAADGGARLNGQTFTWEYFEVLEFRPCPDTIVSGWVFGGSLADLAAQTNLGWWSGKTPPAAGSVGVSAHAENPFRTFNTYER